MKLADISVQDIDVLIDAIDYWVNQDAMGDLVGDLLERTVLKESATEARQRMNSEKEARQSRKATRKETAILLKAKLLLCKKDLQREQPDAATMHQ